MLSSPADDPGLERLEGFGPVQPSEEQLAIALNLDCQNISLTNPGPFPSFRGNDHLATIIDMSCHGK
jgi:hypothetical protein